MSYAIPADEPGGVAPAALSLLVHGVLFAVLVFGLRWQSKHPDAVVAELWSELPAIEPPEPNPEIKPQPKPEPKIEQKTEKPDIALEREKKLPKKKEEPPLKFDTTQRIREQLAQEQKALQDRERKDVLKQFASPPTAGLPDAGYIDKIRTKIKTHIVPPSEIKGNPEVVFNIVQLPTGEVLTVRLVRTSGNALLDSAVERAILKSSPLPKPDRPEQWLREFNISFRPLE
ncbi:MAG TPA: TonB C-terminal domain-containing protein [Burkholderiales bacterium]|nr:TonB C-terminal domain-containing protein [Burkholderiales bacterium]